MHQFVPRYYAIEQELRARIARLQPGDPLPSDADLSREFGVSRMTARQAVQQLKLEGLVTRQPGRGSFVAERATHRQAGKLLSFSEEMRRRGVATRSEVVGHRVRAASAEEARRLELDDGALVLELTRVRIGAEDRIALEAAVLPADAAAALEGADLTTVSLHERLVASGRVPTDGHGTLRADAADAGDARWLGVRKGAPLFVERRLIRDQRGRPLELCETRYVAERYSLDVEFGVELPPRG